jgi:hypothetical protein
MTKSTLKTRSPEDGDPGLGFETAVLLASVSPLSIVTMGTFPLSLIARGRMSRQHLYDSHSLEANQNTLIAEEPETSQQSPPTAPLKPIAPIGAL